MPCTVRMGEAQVVVSASSATSDSPHLCSVARPAEFVRMAADVKDRTRAVFVERKYWKQAYIPKDSVAV